MTDHSRNKPRAARASSLARDLETTNTKDKYQPLKYGDIIYFESSSKGLSGFLSGDGLISKEVGLQTTGPSKPKTPSNFTSCLFRIVPKLKYAAADQLQRLARQKSFTKVEKLNFHDYAVLETRKNNQRLEEATSDGNVQYEEVCQLQHVQSGLFLTGASVPAANRKECLRLSLDRGNSMSYFRLMPRFHYRSEGGLIYCDDILCINSVKIAEHSVHPTAVKVSPVDLPPSVRTSSVTEVNLASGTTGWKISLHYRPATNKLLLANDPIRFYHPEGSNKHTFISSSKLLMSLLLSQVAPRLRLQATRAKMRNNSWWTIKEGQLLHTDSSTTTNLISSAQVTRISKNCQALAAKVCGSWKNWI